MEIWRLLKKLKNTTAISIKIDPAISVLGIYIYPDTPCPTLENFCSSCRPGCLQTDARITKIWYIYIPLCMQWNTALKKKNEVQKFQENGWTWNV